MQRADKLFHIEERGSESPYVSTIWRARSVPATSFISVAASHWEIVTWRHAGRVNVTLRGPETKATTTPIPEDAEFFGVRFKLGAFMPDMSLPRLVDRDLTMRSTTANTLCLGGIDREIPGYDSADVFVARLVRDGLISFDPLVADALADDIPALSRRSVERRVRRATGLTLGTIRQIDRAYRARALLDAGMAIPDVVINAGYADQAHLTRSLKRLMGQTPGHVMAEAR